MTKFLKIFLFGLIALCFMLCFAVKAQSFHPVPKDSINQWKAKSFTVGTDLNSYLTAELYLNAAGIGSVSVTGGTMTVKDFGVDTLTQRLNAIKNYLNSKTATAANQTISAVKLDTANARLLRIANYQSNAAKSLALTSSSATANGTVTAGANSVMFVTSSDFVGSIDGISVGANYVIPFGGGNNMILPQIVFTVSSGSIQIRKLQ